MKARTKLAAFALVLMATFAAAFTVGAAIGPLDDAPAADDTNDDVPLQHGGH